MFGRNDSLTDLEGDVDNTQTTAMSKCLTLKIIRLPSRPEFPKPEENRARVEPAG